MYALSHVPIISVVAAPVIASTFSPPRWEPTFVMNRSTYVFHETQDADERFGAVAIDVHLTKGEEVSGVRWLPKL